MFLIATNKSIYSKPLSRLLGKICRHCSFGFGKDPTLNHRSGSNMSSPSQHRWFPLESNPLLMNKYIENLGFHTHSYQFVDVFSTEEWALSMIPQPVAAVILLYPLTPKQLEHADEPQKESNVWFMKQRISNACGTMGILHALMNVDSQVLDVSLMKDSWLDAFRSKTFNLSPIEKAELLEADEIIRTLHDKATSDDSNQTNRGNLEDRLDAHFIALVRKNNKVYECDGRKESAIEHGDCSDPMELLPKAIGVIKKFMARDPTELRFTMVALVPKMD